VGGRELLHWRHRSSLSIQMPNFSVCQISFFSFLSFTTPLFLYHAKVLFNRITIGKIYSILSMQFIKRSEVNVSIMVDIVDYVRGSMAVRLASFLHPRSSICTYSMILSLHPFIYLTMDTSNTINEPGSLQLTQVD